MRAHLCIIEGNPTDEERPWAGWLGCCVERSVGGVARCTLSGRRLGG